MNKIPRFYRWNTINYTEFNYIDKLKYYYPSIKMCNIFYALQEYTIQLNIANISINHLNSNKKYLDRFYQDIESG